MSIKPCTLFQFYKKNNVKTRYTNYLHKHNITPEWRKSKHDFLLRLALIVKEQLPLLYMDETAFNAWHRPKRTFRGPNDNVRIIIPKTRHSGVTIYGCLGNCIAGGF